jgi:hypothetical protein
MRSSIARQDSFPCCWTQLKKNIEEDTRSCCIRWGAAILYTKKKSLWRVTFEVKCLYIYRLCCYSIRDIFNRKKKTAAARRRRRKSHRYNTIAHTHTHPVQFFLWYYCSSSCWAWLYGNDPLVGCTNIPSSLQHERDRSSLELMTCCWLYFSYYYIYI